MMAVEILGCSGSYAAAGGACTGYLVRSTDAAVWLDCGPGTLSNLQKTTSLGQLAAIVLTHAHPDHWLELPVVANALQWYEPRPDKLKVVSNSHMLGEARQLIGPDLDEVFDWQVVTAGEKVQIADQVWSFAEADHYVPTLAVRADAHGRSLAFSSDTGPSFSFAPMVEADGVIDLVLVESTFLDRAGHEGVLHLSAPEAGRLAGTAQATTLVLTHQAPLEDRQAHLAAAGQAFDGQAVLAQVGETFTVAAE